MNEGNDIVYVIDGEAFTNTLKIANFFERKHKNVLQSARKAIEYSRLKNLAGVKFIESTYTDKNGQQRPMLLLNRNAYSLVVLSYTGEKAREFKYEYIRQFDNMEMFIKESSNALPSNPETGMVEVKPNTAVASEPVQTSAPAVPTSPLEVLQVAIAQMIEQQKRVEALEKKQKEQEANALAIEEKVSDMEKKQKEAQDAVKSLVGEGDSKHATFREKINILVGEVYKANNISPHDIFNDLYDTFRNAYHADLKARFRYNCDYCDRNRIRREYDSILDLAEREGYIQSLYECLKGLCRMRRWC